MKKFFVVLIIIVIFGSIVGKFLAKRVASPPSTTQELTQKVDATITPTPLVFGTPVNLQIPKLGIDATVEQVGLDSQKNMAVPTQDLDVGWYQYGPKPGEAGNSVIAGHFDTHTGAPAVFYHLNDLAPGDEVKVTDENGSTYTFTVVSKDKYPVDNFPIQTVFGKASESYLNLITCDGVWQPSKKLYSDRLVIRTKLKG